MEDRSKLFTITFSSAFIRQWLPMITCVLLKNLFFIANEFKSPLGINDDKIAFRA